MILLRIHGRKNPNFPGPERYGAVSFVLNGKGYVATGGNDFGYLDDLWQYDPVTGVWVRRPDYQPVRHSMKTKEGNPGGFVIGNKAYLGGGDGFVFGPNGTSNIAFYDIWEYDPVNDSWTQKADIPDFIGRDFSIGVAINNKGYVGLGCNVQQNINRQSFWEYDPVTDSWTAKAGFPNNFTTDAGAFVLDSTLYLVGGVNLNPVSLSSQFYKYDPVADVWTALSNFNGGAIAGEFAVSTGTAAFAGTGYTGSLVTRNDLWEFTTATGINGYNLQMDPVANIYPNPAREYISVSSQKTISFIEVYDVTGSRVLLEENTFKNMNVQHLATGGL